MSVCVLELPCKNILSLTPAPAYRQGGTPPPLRARVRVGD